MQKFFLQLVAVALVFTGVLSTGCGEDEPVDPTTQLGPDVILKSEAGYLDTDAELAPSETFKVKLDIAKGDGDLSSVKITVDGADLSTDLFTINDGAIVANNPFIVGDDAKDAVIYDIEITASDVEEVSTYTFEATDANGNTGSVSLTITTVNPVVSTPLNVAATVQVVNNIDGPAGVLGSLDLDNMELVTSGSAEAELVDQGIDTALPVASNWLQQVAPANGATLRMADFSSEGLTFATVDSKEAIVAAYEASSDLAVTSALSEGDLFIVVKGDDYYLFETTTIVTTADNNEDYYEFTIKGHRAE